MRSDISLAPSVALSIIIWKTKVRLLLNLSGSFIGLILVVSKKTFLHLTFNNFWMHDFKGVLSNICSYEMWSSYKDTGIINVLLKAIILLTTSKL